MHEALAERSKETLPWRHWSKSLTVFGIAESGLPLAHAIADGLKQVGISVYEGSLTPGSKDDPAGASLERQVIIVDNAVTTGASIRWAHQLLTGKGCGPIVAIRFFTREEIEEDGLSQEARMTRETGMELLSLFSVRDLLPSVSSLERQKILDGLVLHGTPSVRQYMEEKYVLKNGTWLPRE